MDKTKEMKSIWSELNQIIKDLNTDLIHIPSLKNTINMSPILPKNIKDLLTLNLSNSIDLNHSNTLNLLHSILDPILILSNLDPLNPLPSHSTFLKDPDTNINIQSLYDEHQDPNDSNQSIDFNLLTNNKILHSPVSNNQSNERMESFTEDLFDTQMPSPTFSDTTISSPHSMYRSSPLASKNKLLSKINQSKFSWNNQSTDQVTGFQNTNQVAGFQNTNQGTGFQNTNQVTGLNSTDQVPDFKAEHSNQNPNSFMDSNPSVDQTSKKFNFENHSEIKTMDSLKDQINSELKTMDSLKDQNNSELKTMDSSNKEKVSKIPILVSPSHSKLESYRNTKFKNSILNDSTNSIHKVPMYQNTVHSHVINHSPNVSKSNSHELSKSTPDVFKSTTPDLNQSTPDIFKSSTPDIFKSNSPEIKFKVAKSHSSDVTKSLMDSDTPLKHFNQYSNTSHSILEPEDQSHQYVIETPSKKSNLISLSPPKPVTTSDTQAFDDSMMEKKDGERLKSRLPARVTTNRKSMLGLSNVSFTDNFSFGQDEPSLDGSEPSMTISQLQDLQTNKSESNIGILPPKPISTVELKSEPKPITGVELKSEPKPLISNKILLLDKQVKENLKLEDENGIPARRQSTSFTEDHAQNFHEKRNFFNTDMTSSINSTTDQNRFFSNMTLPDTNRLSITSENTSFSSDFILPDSDDLEKLQSVVSKLARKLKRRERELEKRDLECSNLNDQVESITKTNMMIKKELNDLNSKHDIILQTNETLEKKLNEFDQDVLIIKDLQKALGIVEEEKKSLIALHRTEIEDMNDKLKEMESRYENELKSLNVEQSKTNAEFESKIQMLKDMEVSSDDKNENQEREILDMKQDLQELYNRIQTLMDENELLKIQLIEFNHLSIPNDLGMTLDNNISISKNHQETQVDIQMIDSSHQTNPTKTKLVVSPLSIYEIQPDFEKYQQELNTLEYQITIRDDKFKQYEIENQNLKNQISILNHQLFNSEKEKNELIEENRFYEKTLMNKIKTIQDTITNDQQQLELVTNEMDDIKDGLIRNQKRMIQQQNINKEMDIWIDQTELGLVDIEKQRNDIINEMERYRNNNTQLKKQIYKSRKNQVELGLKSKTPVQALTDIPGVFYSTPVKPIRLLSASPISGDIVEPSFEVNSSLEPKIDSSTPTKKVIVRKDKIQWVNSIWIGCIVMFMIVYYNFVGSVWYGSFPRSTTSSPTFFSDVII